MITKAELENFTGTTQYFKHWTGLTVCTDGFKHLVDQANAYWLWDLVSSYQTSKKIREIPFQLWIVEVNPEDKTGQVTMKEDSDRPIVIKQKLHYTDFPFDSFKFYLIDHVVLLPSEY